jgi:dihydropteroate synthase
MTLPPRPRIMGIVNVTPDSFSDGGLYADTASALAHGRDLLEDGADILDVGGESTRPGATRPVVAEELDRVVPVISGLAALGAVVSVDTMRAEVAAAAVEAGAQIVNDVSGGLADPAMLEVVAACGATYVAMHWRAHSDRMADFATYDGPGGVVGAVVRELGERLEAAVAAGIDPDRVVLDPGLGFAKRGEHNWELLAHLDAVAALGRPLLVGASRKSFLGALLAGPDGTSRPPGEREHAHAALVPLVADQGVWGLRVHDVRATHDALATWQALRSRQSPPAHPADQSDEGARR